jgi:mono/diheme cytochrome c family protein
MRSATVHIRSFAAAAAFAIAASVCSAAPVGDARRGEELFRTEQCITCHSINGKGGSLAPDLARRIDRGYTPAVMASLMWNHAPEMWSAMKKQGVNRPVLSAEAASDLFAYFVSARYFERPGDAGRGKQLFAARHCAECHGITTSNASGAPPVAKWESLADPVILAQQMWNHGPQMRQAFAAKHIKFVPITAQELTDMLVYLQNLPETKSVTRDFRIPSPGSSGEALFQSKGCNGCHARGFSDLFHNQTITGIAAAMWNHQPSMKLPPPTFSQDEMRQIIGYLWAQQYFRGEGSVERGKKVFTEKNCATCHNDPSSGAPKLAKGKNAYSDITMVAALWGHGPRMLDVMNQKKIPWPRFAGTQMSDLIAYLNSL